MKKTIPILILSSMIAVSNGQNQSKPQANNEFFKHKPTSEYIFKEQLKSIDVNNRNKTEELYFTLSKLSFYKDNPTRISTVLSLLNDIIKLKYPINYIQIPIKGNTNDVIRKINDWIIDESASDFLIVETTVDNRIDIKNPISCITIKRKNPLIKYTNEKRYIYAKEIKAKNRKLLNEFEENLLNEFKEKEKEKATKLNNIIANDSLLNYYTKKLNEFESKKNCLNTNEITLSISPFLVKDSFMKMYDITTQRIVLITNNHYGYETLRKHRHGTIETKPFSILSTIIYYDSKNNNYYLYPIYYTYHYSELVTKEYKVIVHHSEPREAYIGDLTIIDIPKTETRLYHDTEKDSIAGVCYLEIPGKNMINFLNNNMDDDTYVEKLTNYEIVLVKDYMDFCSQADKDSVEKYSEKVEKRYKNIKLERLELLESQDGLSYIRNRYETLFNSNIDMLPRFELPKLIKHFGIALSTRYGIKNKKYFDFYNYAVGTKKEDKYEVSMDINLPLRMRFGFGFEADYPFETCPVCGQKLVY